jgi:hypothetical protein
MINVGMAQDNGVQLLRIERKTAISLDGILAPSLEQAAFEQQSLPTDFDQVKRAGSCASGPEKVDKHWPKSKV